MPNSGNKESGVNSRQSSSCSAGIPIKKRKFPLFQPPSPPPPPEEPSFLPAENLMVEGKNSDPTKQSYLSNAGLANSPGKSDASKNLVLEIKKEIPVDTNVNLTKGLPRAPSPEVRSNSLDPVDSKEKILLTENFGAKKVTGTVKLDSASNEDIGKKIFAMAETVELSLGHKEPVIPGLVAGQSSGGSSQMPDKFDDSSLCLSKEKLAGELKSNDVNDDRLNWDLNTTMDAWEGPAGDYFDKLNKSGDNHGVKPLISFSEVLGITGDKGKQIIDSGKNFSNLPMSSLLPAIQCKSEDSLFLSLSTSSSMSNTSKERSGSPAKVDSARVLSNSNLVVGCKTVKSELFDENANLDSLGDRSEPVELSGLRTVNTKLVERCSLKTMESSNINPEKLVEYSSVKSEPVSNVSPEKLAEYSVVKSEPVQDRNQETQRTAETSHEVEKEIQCQDNVSSSMIGGPTCSEMVLGHESKELNESGNMVHPGTLENESFNGPETSRVEAMDYVPMDTRRTSEGSESDEEKINISADLLEEDNYGSDSESEGKLHRVEEEEYEDGEVREALDRTAVEVPVADREVENVNVAPVDNNECKVEDQGEVNDVVLGTEADHVVDRESSLQESSTVEEATGGGDEKGPANLTRKNSVDQSGRNDEQKGRDTEELSDGATNGVRGIETKVSQVKDVNIPGTDTMEKNDSSLLKTGSSLNGRDAAKDTNTGSSRSRIINLPRASNVTSPCKPRFVPEKPFATANGKERDGDFEGEKVYPRRTRGEFFSDGPRRFERERFPDQSFENSRTNFGYGRGRGFRRPRDWDSDHDFATDMYNGPGDYRFPRHKRTSAVNDEDLEDNGYGMGPSRPLGPGRGGRKPSSDESPSFHHTSSSRRLSPGVRGRTGTRGFQMTRRISRNLSPSRDTHEDGEKYMRGPQRIYEGLDSQFARGNRNFSNFRTGITGIRSKSPVRSRTRSPGPWSSPRRRSPDGLVGPRELSRRRSSPIYRMERIRSPDSPFFPEERVARRRGSPPYMARPSNRMGPSEQGFDNYEYFGGPTRSGRFRDVGSDGNGDDRRKFGDRRGPIHSFKPPFNGPDGENLHNRIKNGSRPYRFYPETDEEEFTEQGNLRERELERRVKNRPGMATRRMRNLEDQEGSYGHGGQMWDDDGFDDDVGQMKRRRF